MSEHEPLTDEHLAIIEENRRQKFEVEEREFPSADIKCLLAEVKYLRAKLAAAIRAEKRGKN